LAAGARIIRDEAKGLSEMPEACERFPGVWKERVPNVYHAIQIKEKGIKRIRQHGMGLLMGKRTEKPASAHR
jgi:hypothetical protein